MNRHLDKCTGPKKTKSIHKASSTVNYQQAENNASGQAIINSNTNESENRLEPSSISDNQKETTTTNSNTATPMTATKRPNAFAHMMERSSQVFAESTEPQRLCQRLHLSADGKVYLFCYSPNATGYAGLETIKWSATAQVRDRDPATGVSTPIDLIVSSSIPSLPAEQRPRLVQSHSRLSVPVLKSIFQKSIRRRKPLPSVRVALELMDKSLGDLLRRLPIIIIEDSTLHPDLPLLIWLMVAHSKDYEVSSCRNLLLTRSR
jgi:hypothetical protein